MASFTRKAIMAAFVTLLNEKPLDKITIKDIVEECGINRNTFYYHFQDIPDLIEAIAKEESDLIIEKYARVSSYEECLNIAVEFILKNRRATLHIYNSSNRDIYERYLMQLCQHTSWKPIWTPPSANAISVRAIAASSSFPISATASACSSTG